MIGGTAVAADLEALRRMVLVRRCEEKAGESFALGALEGPCRLSIGQEGYGVGLALAMAPGDRLVAGHRALALRLALGIGFGDALAEPAGNAAADRAAGFLGSYAPLAAQAPVGVGLAHALRVQGATGAAFIAIGEGAMEEGVAAESLRLAARLAVRAIFCVANEGETDFVAFAGLFGVSGVMVEGHDVAAVRAAATAARERGAPALLDCRVRRYRGHSMAEPQKYGPPPRHRPPDPIAFLRLRLSASGALTESQWRAFDADARAVAAAGAARPRSQGAA